MRWYKIVTPTMTWDATNNPNALNVEFDIPVSPEALPKGGASARIWGVALQTLLNAKALNNQSIKVYGGMQQGLPLANPAQQGLLVQGTVFPALGNWVGTDMTLDLFIKGPFGTPTVAKAANVVHNQPKGMPMATAMQQALQAAYPKYKLKININPNLVLPNDEVGFYQTIGQYATWVHGLSKMINQSASYLGIHITVQGDTVVVDDGTVQGAAGKLSYTDLIGQPIWTGVNTMQFKTVMRGDLNINSVVQMPPTLATLTQASNPAVGGSASNLIQGSFTIQQMRHTGNFRSTDTFAWVTTFDAITKGS